MTDEPPPPSSNMQAQAPRIPLSRCQRRLLLLWYIGSVPAFFLLVLHTLGGYYKENPSQAWGWFLPNILPTMLLMTGIVIQGARQQPTAEQTVERFYLRLALVLSLIYLGAVNLPLLYLPFTEVLEEENGNVLCGTKCIELLNQSSLFLGPFQGLVNASLGSVFVTAK